MAELKNKLLRRWTSRPSRKTPKSFIELRVSSTIFS